MLFVQEVRSKMSKGVYFDAFICSLFLIILVSATHATDISLELVLKEVQAIKNNQDLCNSKVIDLEKLIVELQAQNSELKKRLGDAEEKLQKILVKTDQPSAVSDTTKHKEHDKEVPPKEISRKERQLSHRIAFTAGVGVEDLNNLGIHHTIVFDRVITNIGNAYHPNTGIFIAPVKGAYVFTLSTMENGRHKDYLEIVIDGRRITDILTDATTVDVYVSTSKQWILELDSGSEVWIRTIQDYYNQGIHGNMHTMFNGFLLFET